MKYMQQAWGKQSSENNTVIPLYVQLLRRARIRDHAAPSSPDFLLEIASNQVSN